MNRIVFIIAMVLCISDAMAQIDKKTWVASLYSVYGFGSQTGWFNTGVNLRAGYFFIENLAAGVAYRHGDLSETPGTVTTIGIFTRYYGSNNIFLGAGLNSYSFDLQSQFYYQPTYATSLNANFEFGYAAFIGKHVSFEPALVVVTGQLASYTESRLRLNIGISYYFNRKLNP